MAKPKTVRRARRTATAQTPLLAPSFDLFLPLVMIAALLVGAGWWFRVHYAVAFQSPLVVRFQSPVVITERIAAGEAVEVEVDQHGRKLTGWQQYACRKFGRDCRVALAIQRAENAAGKCEIYHYNSDGSLDWGYFQINTVHLQRTDLNLRDLLGCKENIDFAYKLYVEHNGFSPWSTYKSGAYRQFLTGP